MRIRSILLLLLVLLALPGRKTAQKDAAASGKKAESKSDTKSETKSAPPMEKEHWGVLDDLKTGPEPPTSSEFEKYEQPEFVLQLIRVRWRMTDPIDLWVIRPKVAG